MNGEQRVVLRPDPGLTSDQTRDVRASAWRYVFDCYERKKAVGRLPSPDGQEAKGFQREVRPTDIIPR